MPGPQALRIGWGHQSRDFLRYQRRRLRWSPADRLNWHQCRGIGIVGQVAEAKQVKHNKASLNPLPDKVLACFLCRH